MTEQRKASLMRRLKGFMLRHMHGMITCREFEEFVGAYLDDTLPAPQRTKFERHLRICRECREYLAAYRRAIEVGQAVLGAGDDPVPGDVPADLIRAVLDSRRK